MYKKNYLDSVIMRVDFAKEILDIDKALPESFVSEVIKCFPIPEPRVAQGKEYLGRSEDRTGTPLNSFLNKSASIRAKSFIAFCAMFENVFAYAINTVAISCLAASLSADLSIGALCLLKVSSLLPAANSLFNVSRSFEKFFAFFLNVSKVIFSVLIEDRLELKKFKSP